MGSVGQREGEVAWSAWDWALRTAEEPVESLRHQLHKPVFKYFLPVVLMEESIRSSPPTLHRGGGGTDGAPWVFWTNGTSLFEIS